MSGGQWRRPSARLDSSTITHLLVTQPRHFSVCFRAAGLWGRRTFLPVNGAESPSCHSSGQRPRVTCRRPAKRRVTAASRPRGTFAPYLGSFLMKRNPFVSSPLTVSILVHSLHETALLLPWDPGLSVLGTRFCVRWPYSWRHVESGVGPSGAAGAGLLRPSRPFPKPH